MLSTNKATFFRMSVFSLLLLLSINASAGLKLDRTRIIFHQSDSATSVSLVNSGGVYLVQGAITALNDSQTSKDFIVIPPVFRSDSNSLNTIRILRQKQSFPLDRESGYWFRINAIPAGVRPKDGGGVGSVAISLGMSIKMFWRPDDLSLSPEESYSRLEFKQQGDGVSVYNPTPYYQSFSYLEVGESIINLNGNPSMIEPFGSLYYKVSAGNRSASWSLIDDYGSTTPVFHADIK